MKARIMYIENKSAGLSGPAKIGRVRFSKTGRTLYYDGLELKNLNGRGYKDNHVNAVTGDHYWVSGPRKDGADRLYGEGLPVHIDEDVRVEYWTQIRNLPERVGDRVQ